MILRILRAVYLPLLVVIALASAKTSSLFAAETAEATALQQGFDNPPNSAQPRVWWHWLNGNISREGIRKDLEWMQRSGIGGLQNFDVNFAVPAIVDKPIPYMSQEWKEIYRYSVSLAAQLGLEFGIAASPGWSETGGPWVKPEDGMKKLVWSQIRVPGGQAFSGVLPAPPSATGPFQDMAPPADPNPTAKKADPVLYADIAVLAYPVNAMPEVAIPAYTHSDGTVLDAAQLIDGLYGSGVEIPLTSVDAPTVIDIAYEQPQTVRSATLFIPDISDIYSGPTISASLQMNAGDDQWDKVCDITLSTVPTTVSFAPVTASDFRVVVDPVPKAHSNSTGSAPGFDSTYSDAIAAYLAPKNMTLNELKLSPETRVNQFEVKAGFSVARNYYMLDTVSDGTVESVEPADVIDLTDQMKNDGTLEWTPPPGAWQVLRFGYSLLGKTNHPATAEATGLEVDKLDAAAVRDYVQTYLQNYRDAVGPDLIGERGINALLTDSTEVGAFNWTPGLLDEFSRLRGYDARPWLPTLTGAIIDSPQRSDKFLYDFRRTIAELHASAHYGTVAEVAHENGLKVYGESLEGWRPSLGDDMGMRRFADFPMAAIWSYRPEEGPKPLYFADMRGAASVAHLYGQNIAAAESMTSTRHPWDHVPSELRRVVDLEFVHGINRVVVHSSVHQPVDDKVPGLSLRHIGQFFNRHTAWAEMARPWMDYIARSSFLLQQGRFVADVAYFYGEEAPVGAQTWDAYLDDVPHRYAYDFINPEAVLQQLAVKDGELVTAGGARYKLLYLSGTSERMTLGMLRRISELADRGATIVGDAPIASPSLKDDPREYQALLTRLWSGNAITEVGNGRVIAGKDVEAALHQIGVVPDVELLNPQPDTEIPFVHRQLAEGDIYYLNNRNSRPEKTDIRFRVSGKAPQIWRADSGSRVPVSYRIEGDETIVPLSFDPEDAYFVVFVDNTTELSRVVPEFQFKSVASLDQSWTVSFQEGRGAPATIELAQLIPLNAHDDTGVKYFSGIATYSRSFAVPANYLTGEPLILDLGKVGDLAQVWVNKQQIGTVWHSPYRVDISAAVVPGENTLEIRVANRWVNRLIGDAQPDAEKITFTVIPTYSADAPLRPAGLIGPVQLLMDSK